MGIPRRGCALQRVTSLWPISCPSRTAPWPLASRPPAGAIIIGKTNVSPLLGNIQTDNQVFGRNENPWEVERTPGGSSGGAAAALAVGMTPLEVGSDLAGSIRISCLLLRCLRFEDHRAPSVDVGTHPGRAGQNTLA